VSHHQDLVFGVARRLVRDPDDAEDLAQETFIRAYRALRSYDGERIRQLHLRGWLAQIALNLGRNRARSKHVALALEDAPDVPDADSAEPPAVAQRREAARFWTCLLGTLPPRYRRAVELRHVDGLSYPELAMALARPIGTVKSDVHRGVALLRAAYERDAGEPGTLEVTR
jgi:RNA polymerase sigma-70 factor, ECF subfamily